MLIPLAQNYSRVEIKVPDDLLEKIDRSASLAGLSRAAWIKDACQEAINGKEVDKAIVLS